MYRWILDAADRDAVLANVAIREGKNYHVIVEIASVLSPEELLVVRRAYHNRYRRSLEEDIAAHTSGPLRQASLFKQLQLDVWPLAAAAPYSYRNAWCYLWDLQFSEPT